MQHDLITTRAAPRAATAATALRPAAERQAAPTAAAGTPVPLDMRTWTGLFGTAALTPAEAAMLTALARSRTVPAGAAVFDRSDIATCLVLAQRGDVALGYRGVDGVFRIERPVHGPAWLDQSSAWLRGFHAMDARATSEAVIVELPCEALQAQLAQHPGVARQLVTSLAREVQSLSMNTHELMHKDAPARFAAWLVQRLEALGEQQGLVRLDERKRDIASQLAITPETLSRLMRSLARQGVISVAGYSVQVLDGAALRRVAAGA